MATLICYPGVAQMCFSPELGDKGRQFSADGLAMFQDFIRGESDIININYSVKIGNSHRKLDEEGATYIEIAQSIHPFFLD